MTRFAQACSRRTFLAASLCAAGALHAAPAPALVHTPARHGARRLSLPAFRSAHVVARDIDIWIPPGPPGRRWRVLYAHDGKNLFDAAASYSGVPWALDAAMARIAAAGIEPAIIVGIASSAHRSREYHAGGVLPFVDAETAAAIRTTCGGPLLSDAYLRFIVEELKPHIDRILPTRTDRAGTFMLGSSMGGLVSLEALRAYPEVFRGIGCLSAHTLLLGPSAPDPGWRPPPQTLDQIAAGLKAYAAQTFPAPRDHRIWIDRGTEELDALYEANQRSLVEGLRLRGYRNPRQLQARVFAGTGHHERFWAARCEEVLRFLLG